MSRKLYVGNLPYEIGETELQDMFARAGSVESVTVMRDQMTGRARGFAFVEMSTDEEAQKAISDLHEFQLEGRGLVVNEARPKPEGGFGGGGGGGRGRSFGGGGGGRGGGGGDDYGGGRRKEPRW
jgi:cold-inducible RNA-binding protein